MTGRIRIRKYEAVPGCGSFEVRFPDGGRAGSSTGMISRAGGRPEILTREQALEQARAFARAERDRDRL